MAVLAQHNMHTSDQGRTILCGIEVAINNICFNRSIGGYILNSAIADNHDHLGRHFVFDEVI